MTFQEHEKTVYTPPGSTTSYDPLAIDRALTIASGGKLRELLAAWTAGSDDLGDVSNKAKNAVMSAQAEGSLAEIARKAFGMPDFPICLSARCLEYLTHYLEWMEGKGNADGKPR